MSDNVNFNRLSTYVGGIVDRKIKPISMAITGAGSYLRTLTAQAQTYAGNSLASANVSAGHAQDAATAASSSLIVWNSFTSTYLGRQTNDPVLSSVGNTINPGAFYIRASDNRLRVAVSINPNGSPNWADATVTADLSSLGNAGTGIFLSLLQTTSQSVAGPINFQNTVSVPRITSWTSQQPATAIDVNERIVAVQTSVSNEVTRATNAENAISAARVAKTGDTMSGALSIVANGDASSLIVRNNNSTGRQYRFNSTNDGRFRIVDDTGTVERFSIAPNGTVVVNSALSSGSTVTATSVIANNIPSVDPFFSLQTNNVIRWSMARSVSSSRFYIARFNTSGVYIDAPVEINESDGSITLNRTTVRDTVTTNGNITINSVQPRYILNNTSGNNDTVVDYRHLGNTRWLSGRSASQGIYYIARFNSSGTFIDVPLSISEASGAVSINALTVNTTLNVSSSITTPVMYVTANGNGQALRVGDDVWLGDGNVANGLTIRGVQDFNAGYIRFGNSNAHLGCDSNDSTLKYGGQTVYTTGNLSPNVWGYNFGTTNGVDWSTRPAGNGKLYVTMSGYMTFFNQRVGQTVSYPFALQQVMNYHCTNIIPNATQDFDQWAQFVNPPSTSSVTLVMQESAGNARYPIGVRWTVEGIIA